MAPFGTILMTATNSPNETREAHQLEPMRIMAGLVPAIHWLFVRQNQEAWMSGAGKETGMTQGTICLNLREAAAHLDLLTGMPDRYRATGR